MNQQNSYHDSNEIEKSGAIARGKGWAKEATILENVRTYPFWGNSREWNAPSL